MKKKKFVRCPDCGGTGIKVRIIIGLGEEGGPCPTCRPKKEE